MLVQAARNNILIPIIKLSLQIKLRANLESVAIISNTTNILNDE